MNPRYKRLQRDFEKLQELAARSHIISIESTEGNPPEKYVIRLNCRGITDVNSGQPTYGSSHLLGINLRGDYPRRKPDFEMLTQVFHPNIGRGGQVCIGDEGDHGYAPAMGLDDLVVRIVQMIRYENVGYQSAFNSYAADWAYKHRHLFPLDTSQIVGEELLEIDIMDEVQIILPKSDQIDSDLDIVIY